MNTESVNALIQLKAFARIAGLKMAVLWTISFACFAAQFRWAGFGVLWLLSIPFIPFYQARLAMAYRNGIGGALSFRRAWLLSVYTFLYAAILFALVQYVYFAFIDRGTIISQYVSILSDPAYAALMKAYGYSASDVKELIAQITQVKPIGIALNCMVSNIIAGLVVALPVAALTKRTATNNQQEQ